MAAIALQSKFVERKQFPKREKYKGSGRWPTRFTPFWLKNEIDPPVFFLRVGGELDRELFQTELADRFNAPAVYTHELREAMLTGLSRFAAPGDLNRLMMVTDAGFAGKIDSAADKALYAALEKQMRENWPPFHALCQRMETRQAIIPALAFMKFCIGWRNVRDIETRELISFAQDKLGLVDRACIARVDPLEMRAAGNRAYHLLMAN